MSISTPLVQIRERSYLDLVDLSLLVVRRRPIVFALASAAGVIPCVALNAWIVSAAPDFPAYFLFVLFLVEIPWATAPLTIVLGGLMFGDRPRAGRVARTMLRSIVPMLLFQGLIRGFLLATAFLAILIPIRLAFLDEVILLERGRWRDAVTRCGVLSGDQGGSLFGRTLVAWVFGFLFVVSFRWGTTVLASILLGTSDWELETAESRLDGFLGWMFDFRDPLGLLATWIVVSFFGVVRFLTYIDQRIRLEGWEVELRLKAAGAAIEESLRW